MNQENTEKLWSSFPNLYRDKDAPITESLIPFGFECSDGWFQLIWDLSEALEKEILELSGNERWHYRASQVKEKFATLRFHMTGSTDKMNNLINKAEEKSSQTCETCGKQGTTYRRGWIYTSCADCEATRIKTDVVL
jgi:hypothetical protein